MSIKKYFIKRSPTRMSLLMMMGRCDKGWGEADSSLLKLWVNNIFLSSFIAQDCNKIPGFSVHMSSACQQKSLPVALTSAGRLWSGVDSPYDMRVGREETEALLGRNSISKEYSYIVRIWQAWMGEFPSYTCVYQPTTHYSDTLKHVAKNGVWQRSGLNIFPLATNRGCSASLR